MRLLQDGACPKHAVTLSTIHTRTLTCDNARLRLHLSIVVVVVVVVVGTASGCRRVPISNA